MASTKRKTDPIDEGSEKKLETKIIYFDIDGTLRDENLGISEKTKYMINECKRQGIKTIICTGRNPGSIQQDVLDLNMDGAIYSGGCYIKFQDKVIKKTCLSKHFIKEISDKNIFGIAIETEQNVYMNQNAATIYQKLFLKKTKNKNEQEREKIKKINRFLYQNNINEFDLQKEEIYKICLIDKRKILEQLQEDLEDKCSVVQLIPFEKKWLLECVPLHCDKGAAVKLLNNFLGIKKEESMGFGDGDNDIELLGATGTGIAMKESSKKLLHIADAVCDSVRVDGIYKECVNRKLIKEKKE